VTYRTHLRAMIVVLALFAAGTLASSEDYDYPIEDRYEATVVGTPVEFQAVLPKNIPFKKRWIKIFPQRELPEAVWYGGKLLYSQALQRKTAPLIFLIAGTGASHKGSKNYDMARAFYQAGFHVVSLSSPTYPNFVTAASTTGVVGHSEKDAEDLYRVMEMIWKTLDDKIEVSSFNLTGYSLGAFNAAYVAKLDEERGAFNFDRVLMINPPVSLYNSISLLDRMIENIPGGIDNFDKFVDDLMVGVAEVYRDSEDDLGEDFLLKATEILDLKNEELAALIGTSFRISSASLVFTSDVMADFGYIKPKGLPLGRRDDLTIYAEVANRLGFTDYYHKFFYPYYRDEYPDQDRDEFISAISLEKIADYLRDSSKIQVFHNADDIILEPGEIDFFSETFGDRATIYPRGGHCGNINHRDNVAAMLAVFTEGGAR
jgi:hypothetical protein